MARERGPSVRRHGVSRPRLVLLLAGFVRFKPAERLIRGESSREATAGPTGSLSGDILNTHMIGATTLDRSAGVVPFLTAPDGDGSRPLLIAGRVDRFSAEPDCCSKDGDHEATAFRRQNLDARSAA
jgi:hypothetical protein